MNLGTELLDVFQRAIFDELMAEYEDRALVEKCWEVCKNNAWDGPIMYKLLQLKAKL